MQAGHNTRFGIFDDGRFDGLIARLETEFSRAVATEAVVGLLRYAAEDVDSGSQFCDVFFRISPELETGFRVVDDSSRSICDFSLVNLTLGCFDPRGR